MKNLFILSFFLIVLFQFIDANASPRNAELVLDNIQIEPQFPTEGESIVITGDVYNAGIESTNSFASIITVAYFVDGQLAYINEIGDVDPGIQNKIKISSIPLWDAKSGKS